MEVTKQLKSPECPICLDNYDSIYRIPIIIMPCGHTVDKLCIQDLKICPVCRGVIEKIQNNWALLEILNDGNGQKLDPIPVVIKPIPIKKDLETTTVIDFSKMGGKLLFQINDLYQNHLSQIIGDNKLNKRKCHILFNINDIQYDPIKNHGRLEFWVYEFLNTNLRKLNISVEFLLENGIDTFKYYESIISSDIGIIIATPSLIEIINKPYSELSNNDDKLINASWKYFNRRLQYDDKCKQTYVIDINNTEKRKIGNGICDLSVFKIHNINTIKDQFTELLKISGNILGNKTSDTNNIVQSFNDWCLRIIQGEKYVIPPLVTPTLVKTPSNIEKLQTLTKDIVNQQKTEFESCVECAIELIVSKIEKIKASWYKSPSIYIRHNESKKNISTECAKEVVKRLTTVGLNIQNKEEIENKEVGTERVCTNEYYDEYEDRKIITKINHPAFYIVFS